MALQALVLILGLMLLAAPARAELRWLELATALDAPPPPRQAASASSGPAEERQPAGRPVALPDDWSQSWPGRSGERWYRIELPGTETERIRQSGELQGLYVERACSVLEVRLNGEPIHIGGRFTEPISRQCQRPQLVGLPAGLLVEGLNRLDLRVKGHALAEVTSRQRAGGLSALQLGPYEQLAAHQARRSMYAVLLPEVLSGTLLLMGSLMFVMGWFNRAQSYLAYFGVLMVAWALILARLWVLDLPVSHVAVEIGLAVLTGIAAWGAVQFMLRYAGERIGWLNLALPLQVPLMAVTLVLAAPNHLYSVSMAWYLVLALEVVVAAVHHLGQVRQQGGTPMWLMAGLLGLVALAMGVDGASSLLSLDARYGLAAQVVPPLIFVVMGLRLVQQFGRAYLDSEQSRAQLEERIRQATAQIERNFTQLAELKVEQVTDRERKRIAADLHDDLGAKLLTIVHTSDNERISTLAREALEEMRLSVRGLTGKPVKLVDALGDWRAEVVSRLTQAGVQSEWEAPSDEDLPMTLSSRAYVQTTRILREAVSNIIKHSGASYCTVRCSLADGDFQCVVQDNGKGISTEIEGRLDKGHGMASMKGRAKQLQGQCLVESSPGYGTVIRLTLPLEPHITRP